MSYSFSELAYVYGLPEATGQLKATNADFHVEEIMPIELSGEGEHLWVWVEKDGSNTDWVAQQLAKIADIKSMAVSYAGMKDRHGITQQWFSLHLPGMDDPDFSQHHSDEYRILKTQRHDRKLKRGALSGNRFKIRISNLQANKTELQQRLQKISEQGVANYFGEQRFGRDMGNLHKAEKLFRRELKKVKKQHRGLYLSAARSWIFNQVLSARIKQGNWAQAINGDVFMLNGKSACFAEPLSDDIYQRLNNGDINLTACLWGEGDNMATQEVAELEKNTADEFSLFSEGLVSARLKQERRAMRLIPENLNWDIAADYLMLEFTLPAGCFATMVLREIVKV